MIVWIFVMYTSNEQCVFVSVFYVFWVLLDCEVWFLEHEAQEGKLFEANHIQRKLRKS
jgi:hypothetical protein